MADCWIIKDNGNCEDLVVVFHTKREMKAKAFNHIIHLINDTASEISEEYFLLPVAGLEKSQQRERNYCYELYRLLRNNWSREIGYSINGEVDKTNHPMISEQCGNIKPDFIVHRPGRMNKDDNLLVVEVKTVNGASSQGLIKDIHTLHCMTQVDNGYYGALLLIVGPIEQGVKDGILNRIRENLLENQKLIIIFHSELGKSGTIHHL